MTRHFVSIPLLSLALLHSIACLPGSSMDWEPSNERSAVADETPSSLPASPSASLPLNLPPRSFWANPGNGREASGHEEPHAVKSQQGTGLSKISGIPLEINNMIGKDLNSEERFCLSVTCRALNGLAKNFDVKTAAKELTNQLIDDTINSRDIQRLLPVQLASSVLLDSWFRNHREANDRMERSHRFNSEYYKRGKVYSAAEWNSFRDRLATTLKPFHTNLQTIENEWGYIRYQKLDPRERMTLFPLVEILATQSVANIHKILVNLYQSTIDLETIYTALDFYKDESIRTLTSEVKAQYGLDSQRVLHNAVVQEPLWGAIAVLAARGEFTKLKDLAEITVPNSQFFSQDIAQFIGFLLLEYGPMEHYVWAKRLLLYRSYNQSMARLFGFTKAVRAFPDDQSIAQPHLIRSYQDVSAFGHVHFYRETAEDRKPQLAFRVHRPTATKMLRLEQMDPLKIQWLSQDKTHELLLKDGLANRFNWDQIMGAPQNE
ncbi:hypothetical protein BJ085DRAFT_35956 [Dimargaris cristalligena]|uniref:F-box domain-containing protein n=1 Tax=Dimargaris cristalligena TaxID=215637 RepID=A0A4V1J3U7_9FUNG|nr:hypothetical protein BJ085DRAFT_35956 [Dimargaris cristalligena]|eukprot:RKP33299.1 hypothetical protein BJ085DRAFT_35956 [Dimargaris cristalligena]